MFGGTRRVETCKIVNTFVRVVVFSLCVVVLCLCVVVLSLCVVVLSPLVYKFHLSQAANTDPSLEDTGILLGR